MARPQPNPAAELVPLALVQLFPSPLNPRRVFDPDGIDSLAQSIRRDGLLQNLVVRKLADDTTITLRGAPAPAFELIAGERRYHALQALAKAGDWDAGSATIPCRVVEADHDEARALALLENLARQDLPPLEEGEAYKALQAIDAERWSTSAIAERVGRTQRYVQQRLALAVKLAPEARAALGEGKINIEQARALTGAAPAAQASIVEDITREHSWLTDPEEIEDHVRSGYMAADLAIFDLARYTGKTIEDADGKRWLVDGKQALKLQKKAAKLKLAKLGTEWAWAKLASYMNYWHYEKKRSEDRKAAGALVILKDTGEVKVETGLVRKKGYEDPAAAGEQARKEQERWKREAEEREARRKQVEAWIKRVRQALAGNEDMALRVLLFHGEQYRDGTAKAWGRIQALKPAQVLAGLTVAGAAHFNAQHWTAKPDIAAIAIAKLIGIDPPECWAPKPKAPAKAGDKAKPKNAPGAKPKKAAKVKPAGKKKAAA